MLDVVNLIMVCCFTAPKAVLYGTVCLILLGSRVHVSVGRMALGRLPPYWKSNLILEGPCIIFCSIYIHYNEIHNVVALIVY